MVSSETLRAASGPNRRQLIAGATGLAGALIVPGAASAQDASAENADFLFVQTADAMAFDADQNRLTLRDVSPTTLFFSDRPERIAGNMTTESFVPFWSEGKDSFLSDPPNADISILEKGTLRQTVAVLHDPTLENGDLHYTVEIIDGDMPVTGENVSVFIDVIGMPLTPLSVAGVRRRDIPARSALLTGHRPPPVVARAGAARPSTTHRSSQDAEVRPVHARLPCSTRYRHVAELRCSGRG